MGSPIIYAARELSTAWTEYDQGLVQHPALIARLVLSTARLADLTDLAVLDEHDIHPPVHKTKWRAELDEGKVPATHRLREMLLGKDFDEVIYPSSMSPGGTCVALWRWNGPTGPPLAIVDPEGRLPRNAASWLLMGGIPPQICAMSFPGADGVEEQGRGGRNQGGCGDRRRGHGRHGAGR